jgi:hypothetical protein
MTTIKINSIHNGFHILYLDWELKNLLLPNIDHSQQVEDYVRGCTWQLKKSKIFIGLDTRDILNVKPANFSWFLISL